MFTMSNWIKLYIFFLTVVGFECIVCNLHTKIKRNGTYTMYNLHK